MGVSRGEEFLGTLHPLFTTLHLSWFGGGCVISLWFTLFLLFEELGYVVGRVRICCWKSKNMLLRQPVSSVAQQLLCACIAADMRLHNRWCACDGQLLCAKLLSRLMMHPPQGRLAVLHLSLTPSGLALQFTPVGLWNRWRVVKSGWRVAANSSPLEMPINTGVSEGKVKSEE